MTHHGINKRAINCHCQSAVHLAVINKDVSMLDLLQNLQFDPNMKVCDVLMIFEQPNIKHLLPKHNTFVYVSVTHRQQQHHFI